jgi:hypothetical protein
MFLALARLLRRRHFEQGVSITRQLWASGVTFSLPFTTLHSAAMFAFSDCMSAVGWLIRSFMMDMLAIANRARLIFVSSNVLEG